MRKIRTLISGAALGVALTATGLVATAAEAYTYPVYFAGGGEGTTKAAAEAAAQADADADEAAYEAETSQTCTITNRSASSYQLAPYWWGAYVLETANCG
jgi:hypothetical protein